MSKEKNHLIVAKDDHAIIMGYIKKGLNRSMYSRQEAEKMESELKKAKLVDKSQLPDDVVCLNSTVIIKEDKAEKLMELTLVIPEKSDIRQKKISIFSPIAAALIGARKGTKVAWRVPAGLKTFCIIDVQNPMYEITFI